MNQDHILPSTGFLRIRRVKIFVPMCESQIWEEVKRGSFPAPIKLSKGITAWRVEDIKEYIDKERLPNSSN